MIYLKFTQRNSGHTIQYDGLDAVHFFSKLSEELDIATRYSHS